MTTTVADVDAAGQATAYLQERLKGRPQPTVGVICGSGLARLSEAIRPETKLSISFSEIPCFPYLGVAGHHAELVFGSIGASEVAVVRGRAHSYEGHSMQTVVLATRVFAKLGVAVLIVTNAAGGIRRDFNVGDVRLSPRARRADVLSLADHGDYRPHWASSVGWQGSFGWPEH